MSQSTYDQKFAQLIQLLRDPDTELVFIHHPEVLGDNYEELVESLNRISDSGKRLQIVPRKRRGN